MSYFLLGRQYRVTMPLAASQVEPLVWCAHSLCFVAPFVLAFRANKLLFLPRELLSFSLPQNLVAVVNIIQCLELLSSVAK